MRPETENCGIGRPPDTGRPDTWAWPFGWRTWAEGQGPLRFRPYPGSQVTHDARTPSARVAVPRDNARPSLELVIRGWDATWTSVQCRDQRPKSNLSNENRPSILAQAGLRKVRDDTLQNPSSAVRDR